MKKQLITSALAGMMLIGVCFAQDTQPVSSQAHTQRTPAEYKQINTNYAKRNIQFLQRNLNFLSQNPEVSQEEKQAIQQFLPALTELTKHVN